MDVLEYLKKHGQRLDLEIAKETGVPLAAVRRELAALAASGEIIMCKLTRFNHGQRTDAWQCRASGYFPPLSPDPKPKPVA
jgi:predicted ArsR family transcriptional regulator